MKELFDNTMSCPKPKWYKELSIKTLLNKEPIPNGGRTIVPAEHINSCNEQ